MFKDLFVLEKQGTKKEAVGFFLAYLLASGGVFGLISGFVTDGAFAEGFDFGLAIGPYWHGALPMAVSALVLFRKGRLRSFRPELRVRVGRSRIRA